MPPWNMHACTWDDGYPSGGNYWSDYSGTDSDGDGIGDTVYVIDPDNQDDYPLMGPWTIVGERVTVTPSEGVSVSFGEITSEGVTTCNVTTSGPDAQEGFKLAQDPPTYYDINTTASYIGTIALCIAYNDTDLTPQEEEALELMQWNETLVQWESITTWVDVDNNLIYGETAHLSTFGLLKPFILGDVNRDISVDIIDLYEIGKAYGATLGSPNWNEACDINGDEIINEVDLAILEENYGKAV